MIYSDTAAKTFTVLTFLPSATLRTNATIPIILSTYSGQGFQIILSRFCWKETKKEERSNTVIILNKYLNCNKQVSTAVNILLKLQGKNTILKQLQCRNTVKKTEKSL